MQRMYGYSYQKAGLQTIPVKQTIVPINHPSDWKVVPANHSSDWKVVPINLSVEWTVIPANSKVNKTIIQSARGFHLRRQMASCVLVLPKLFRSTETTCPIASGKWRKNTAEVGVFLRGYSIIKPSAIIYSPLKFKEYDNRKKKS